MQALLLLEVLLIAFAVILAVGWIASGDGTYEPPLALIGIVLGVLEFIRRTGKNPEQAEVSTSADRNTVRPRARDDLLPDEVTVCAACTHFRNKQPGSDTWYNHFCAASPLPRKIDPFDGQLKSYGVNDLGGEYFTEDENHYCRSINDGACPKFMRVSSGDA